MKKTILISAAFISCFVLQAQINKGRMMLGVSFNYSQSGRQDTYRNIQPQQNYINTYLSGFGRYGFFISNHVLIGILTNGVVGKGTSWSNDAQGIKVTNTRKSKDLRAGIFGRYYQLFGKSKLALFGQLSTMYGGGRGTEKSEIANVATFSYTTEKSYSFWMGLDPGLTYFINKNFAIESSVGFIGYSSYKITYFTRGEESLSIKTSNLNFNFLQNFLLGINFYFGKSSEPVAEKVNP